MTSSRSQAREEAERGEVTVADEQCSGLAAELTRFRGHLAANSGCRQARSQTCDATPLDRALAVDLRRDLRDPTGPAQSATVTGNGNTWNVSAVSRSHME